MFNIILVVCLPRAITCSNSILSRVIADVNITLTSLADRVTVLHEEELPSAIANASEQTAAATIVLLDDISSTLSQRMDVLHGQCGGNITSLGGNITSLGGNITYLGQSFTQQLLDVNQTMVEAVNDLSARSHAHTLALEHAVNVSATALSELASLHTLSNASLGLLVDRLDASEALFAYNQQVTNDVIADLSALLAQVIE